MMRDDEIMLSALQKEREQLHQKIMQLDRIIKKVKSGEYLGQPAEDGEQVANVSEGKQPERLAFPKQADIKVQVLTVFDILKKAAKLNDIQDEYNRLTGTNYGIRETLRSLQRSKLLVQIKEKDASRGFLWAKADWIDNGQLMDEYKPEGFDLLYKPDNLEYE